MPICAVVDCRNNPKRDKACVEEYICGRKYHKFPKDKAVAKVWATKCKRRDKINIKNSTICSDHFLASDYERDLKSELLHLPPKKILLKGAVPSVFKSRLKNNNKNTLYTGTNEDRANRLVQRSLKASIISSLNEFYPVCQFCDQKMTTSKMRKNMTSTNQVVLQETLPSLFVNTCRQNDVMAKKVCSSCFEEIEKIHQLLIFSSIENEKVNVVQFQELKDRFLNKIGKTTGTGTADFMIGEMSNYQEEYEEPLWTPGGVDKIEIIDENPQVDHIVEYADPLADDYHNQGTEIVLENNQAIEEPFVQTTHYINITELLKSQNGGSDAFLPDPPPRPQHLQQQLQSKKPIPIAPKRTWNLPTTTTINKSTNGKLLQARLQGPSSANSRPTSVSTTTLNTKNPAPLRTDQHNSCVFCYNITPQNNQNNMTNCYKMELINFINIFGLPVKAFWLIFEEYRSSINVMYCRTCSSIFQETNHSTKLRLFKEISKKSRKLPLRGGFYDLVNQLRRIFIDIFRLEEEKRIKLIFPKSQSQFQAPSNATANVNYKNNTSPSQNQRPISFVQVQPGVSKPPRQRLPSLPSNNLEVKDNIVLKCTDCEFIFLGPKVMASAMLAKHKLTHKKKTAEVEPLPKSPALSLPTPTPTPIHDVNDNDNNDQDDDFINPLNFVEVEQKDDETEIPPNKKNVKQVQGRTRPCPKSRKPPVEAVQISSDDDDDEVKEITIDIDSDSDVDDGDKFKNPKDHQEVLADSIYGKHVLEMLKHEDSKTCVMCYNDMTNLPITYDLKRMIKFMDIPPKNFETILKSKLYVFANFCQICSTLIQNFGQQEDRNKLIELLKTSYGNSEQKHDKSADVNQIRQLLYEYYTFDICDFHSKMKNGIKKGKPTEYCSICRRVDHLRNKLKQEAKELMVKLKTKAENENSNEKSIEAIEDSDSSIQIKENANVQAECKSNEKKDKLSLIKDSCTRRKNMKKLAKYNCQSQKCSKSFVNLKALLIHGMSQHKNQSSKKPFIERLQNLKCDKCESEKYFKTLKILKKHQIMKHNRKSTTLNGTTKVNE